MPVLPPPPVQDQPGSYAWLDWYRQLRNYISQTGSVPWSVIDFSGSDISDIVSRSHSALSALQGGTVGQYYHLTSAEYTALVTSAHAVQSVAVDTTLNDSYPTTYVTATGKTMTLPAASSSRIGFTWTVHLATTGYTDVQRNGSDTIILPTNDTKIRLNNKGSSVSLRCLSATTWGIV